MFSLWGPLSGAFHQKSKIRAGFVNVYNDLEYFLGCLSGVRAHADTRTCGRRATQACCHWKEDENKTELKMVSCQTCAICAFGDGFGGPKVTSRLVFCFTLSSWWDEALPREDALEKGRQPRTGKMRTQNASLWGVFLFHFWIPVFQNNLRVWKQKDFDI